MRLLAAFARYVGRDKLTHHYMLSISHSYPQYLEPELQEQALSIWQSGGVVALPTETVYGLGADARNGEAVAQIYALKSRPRFNPLIVHVADAETAKRYVVWNEWAEKLAVYWPGPLTMVLKHTAEIADIVTAGGDTVGVRVPAHPIAHALLKAFDGPIAAPSANRSGRISPTTAGHVQMEFGSDVPLIIDGGPCHVGVESTVIDLSGAAPRLLRPGAITRAMIEDVLGIRLQEAEEGGTLKSPGMLASHYAPARPLRLNATTCEEGEGLLAFGSGAPEAETIIQLSASGDLMEAATNLFAALRALDAHPHVHRIAAMHVPDIGIGEAINDRLRRAAAPKDV